MEAAYRYITNVFYDKHKLLCYWLFIGEFIPNMKMKQHIWDIDCELGDAALKEGQMNVSYNSKETLEGKKVETLGGKKVTFYSGFK